jgi:hypothetical protein
LSPALANPHGLCAKSADLAREAAAAAGPNARDVTKEEIDALWVMTI